MKRSVLLALALYIGCQKDSPIVQNLSQAYCGGDDSYFTLIIRFTNDHGAHVLPTAVDAFLIDREIHGTTTDTLKGVASGKVIWFDEVNKRWREFIFWYDFSP